MGPLYKKNAFGASFVGLPFYIAVCARRVPAWPDARCPVRSAFRASAAPGTQIATEILRMVAIAWARATAQRGPRHAHRYIDYSLTFGRAQYSKLVF